MRSPQAIAHQPGAPGSDRRRDSRRVDTGKLRLTPSASWRVACGTFPTARRRRHGLRNEAVLDRVADDGGVALQFQLLKDAAAVRTHGFRADSQLGGDLLERRSGAE